MQAVNIFPLFPTNLQSTLPSMRPVLVVFFFALAFALHAERLKRPSDAAPEIHMLVPGFEVKELPVKLTNAVNLQYRHDGKLVVLGYNGDIHLLSDTDGDGLEDHAELFWKGSGKISAPIGMDLAPKGSPHGDAVFLACKGKVMMVTDRDGDGRADEERVLAEGWPPARAGVDTASLCLDPKDGSIYFGLGVRWYNNAYELDERGVAHNDLSSERGAILRIAPDFKSREKLCTGVRWPVGLRFNAEGDLFCTDQEGATWLPNGNPFDELLLIERGRHYGFPPRHPRHLPNVIDEPSVFDYGPQHQSTCGLRFNEGVNGGPIFGPAWWRGDALIAGESRGKIYRTKLVKTDAGYVAHNEIIACLNQLTVDVTLSPRGDLLVATHTGDPDWGTGPGGMGRIFRLSYTDRVAPQPVMAWSASPGIIRVAFDKPVAPDALGPATVERGLYTRAGDRHETMWPGYEVIKLQQAAPVLPVEVRKITRVDERTVDLEVPPQSAVEHFAIQLGSNELHAELTGVAASWKGDDGRSWSQWWPHLDTGVCQALLGDHFTRPGGGGELTLRTRLDLWSMLRPAIQPGASLDHDPAPEQLTLWIASPDAPFTVESGVGGKKTTTASQQGQVTHDVFVTLTPAKHQPLDLVITARSATVPRFQVSWHTKEDARPRALPLRRFLVPWARPELTPGLAAPLPRPEIAGADWSRGRNLFFSDKILCAKCHQVRGQGGRTGPDLSNLTSRSHASVLKDIREPNATLNPDYIAHDVKLKDGRQFLAVLRDEADDRVVLGIGAGAEITVGRNEIASAEPSKVSIMPTGIDQLLNEEELRDLLAYLLTEPPSMKVYADGERPVARTHAEIDAVLAGAPDPPESVRPLKLLLVSGNKDHGKGEHDYPRWREAWSRLFTLADQVKIDLAEEWPTPEQWGSGDAVIFNRRGDWSGERAADFDAFLGRGGGATFIHWSLEAGDQAPAAAERLGFASNRALTKYRHGAVDLTFEDAARQHPIVRGLDRLRFVDEMYWDLVPSPNTKSTILATAAEAGQSHPHAWTVERPGGGRIFVTLGGHYSWVFDDPLFRVLVLRGIAWTAHEPVDRFNNLVEVGVE